MLTGRPQQSEAASFYFTYINEVKGDEPLAAIEIQLEEALSFFAAVSEEKSRYRYAAEKWSIREALNHINDTERVFALRALWFARGCTAALPGFDQNITAAGADADRIPWASHVEEFRQIRLSTISLFRHLPPEAWMRSGVASDSLVTVRALSFIIPGHVAHHIKVLRTQYLLG